MEGLEKLPTFDQISSVNIEILFGDHLDDFVATAFVQKKRKKDAQKNLLRKYTNFTSQVTTWDITNVEEYL